MPIKAKNIEWLQVDLVHNEEKGMEDIPFVVTDPPRKKVRYTSLVSPQ